MIETFVPEESIEQLKGLGEKTAYPTHYDPQLLESIGIDPSPYTPMVELEAFEFTSLCPKTGQPDFGTIKIRYTPSSRLVESKSLKLYLGSFRNHGIFHEAVVETITKDLVEALDPLFLEVRGQFNPRGGIAIIPTSSYVKPLDSGETSQLDLL